MAVQQVDMMLGNAKKSSKSGGAFSW